MSGKQNQQQSNSTLNPMTQDHHAQSAKCWNRQTAVEYGKSATLTIIGWRLTSHQTVS
jgi:hypothetical protein